MHLVAVDSFAMMIAASKSRAKKQPNTGVVLLS